MITLWGFYSFYQYIIRGERMSPRPNRNTTKLSSWTNVVSGADASQREYQRRKVANMAWWGLCGHLHCVHRTSQGCITLNLGSRGGYFGSFFEGNKEIRQTSLCYNLCSWQSLQSNSGLFHVSWEKAACLGATWKGLFGIPEQRFWLIYYFLLI